MPDRLDRAGPSTVPVRGRVTCAMSRPASTQAAGLAALLDELEWRGILHATTPGLPARLAPGRPIAGYIGFDPTADSLHVGHLIPIFGLIRLQRHGGGRSRSWAAGPG